MNAKRVIGFILLFGAIFAFGNKLLGSMSSNSDNTVIYFFLGVIGFILLLGIGRVLRS